MAWSFVCPEKRIVTSLRPKALFGIEIRWVMSVSGSPLNEVEHSK